ncbi:ModD protein [Marichromatium bheemlicum]|uniref:Putative pyrophosphorylase ModD n=1 Tax=Marichromatium bheemlicum TaxID=365339 RepID=A0ABX1I860_9GAMM|nr:ModD protein [Marichromatium bheemlicum]NKN33757.1 ModD protein [Marichromatium bheemlicum]
MIRPQPLALDDHRLQQLLAEDVPYGDLTTEALAIDARPGQIRLFARDPMVVCGIEEAARMFTLCGARATLHAASGQQAAPETLLLEASAEAGILHRAWKSAQTLVEWCSGVASRAAEIQEAARRGHPEALVALTRKNVPGTRRLAVKAARAAGAAMHRTGLSETLLVFAEHRLFLDEDDPAAAIARLRRHCPEKRVVVEVEDVAEALAWAAADVIQLEKFSPAAVAETVAALAAAGSTALVAAAGGVNAANAEDYARAGARLLVTSAPHLAPPRDVQVRFARGV